MVEVNLNVTDPGGYQAARKFREAEAARISQAFSRESIDRAEAVWLAERIGRDGNLSENEQMLLKFIKDNSPKIDEALKPVFEKAGL